MPFFTGTSSSLDVSATLPAIPVLLVAAGLFLFLLHRFWLSRLDPKPRSLGAGPLRHVAAGALGALALAAFSLLAAALGGGFRSESPGWSAFPSPGGAAASGGPLRLLAGFLVQSLSEELLFRGVLMGGIGVLFLFLLSFVTVHPLPGEPAGSPRLAAARRRTWLLAGLLANAVQAALFTAVHGANPGVTPLASGNIALAGLVLGWLFWSQGSLLGAWAWHFLWNFSLAAAGLPVSGVLAAPALLPLGISGARTGLLSGGSFGPEASLPCTAGLLALLALQLAASRRTPGPDGP
ncbi:MAG TPA: CPBP family intramembrane metalloprotease [Thermoanaerobaculia bacterium]|nr:CPBP family intramembrane metalloprotease [Thermoanaerobaculia bacterium]